MINTVGAYEPKTHLPRLLDDVAQGQSYVITKRGIPVARLVPVGEQRFKLKRAAVEALKDYQQTAPSLGHLTIKELVEEGRR